MLDLPPLVRLYQEHGQKMWPTVGLKQSFVLSLAIGLNARRLEKADGIGHWSGSLTSVEDRRADKNIVILFYNSHLL